MSKAADAALRVLQESKGPFSPSEIADIATKKGYWKTRAQNPAASISGAISTENRRLGAQSRFRSAGQGRWTLRVRGRTKAQTETAQRGAARLPNARELRTHAKQVRAWICQILRKRHRVLSIAVMSGGKHFEGWLKFEVAAQIQKEAPLDVRVEVGRPRVDIAYRYKRCRHLLELKTSKHPGHLDGLPEMKVGKAHNAETVAQDIARFKERGKPGVVAFVLFPGGGRNWEWDFVHQIEEKARLFLGKDDYKLRMQEVCESVKLKTVGGAKYEVVVGAIPVDPEALG